MPKDQNDFLNDNKGSSPVKVILIIAVVVAIAAIGYLLAGRAGNLPSDKAHTVATTQDLNEGTIVYPQTGTDAPEKEAAPAEQSGITSYMREIPSGDAAPADFDIAQALAPRGLGDPNAPIKLKEFFSLTCNHCANFHNITLPQIKQYIDSGEVYLEFNDFPLNAPALRASMVARCLPEDKYYGYITLLFKTQDTWITNPDYMGALRQNAKLAGMSDEAFDSCVGNGQLQQAMIANMQEATTKWNIESTPIFVVNEGAVTFDGEPALIKGAQPAYEFERVFRTVSGGKVAPLLKDQQQNTQTE